MAQHDMDVANAAGATVRADINNALQALVSRNSGSSAPSTTFAYMEWVDTTTGVKKRRNAANSGWLVDSTIDETLVLARSSNTILGVSDRGKTVVATGSWTQTLTAAATLADGWFIDYRNDGSGSIVLDPNSTEQIDGATTLTLAAGESCRIVCNASAFKTVGRTVTSVTSAVAGSGIAVSAATGAVTFSQDIYTGSSSSNLDFPVGTIIAVHATAAGTYTRNNTITPYVDSSLVANAGYSDTVSGTALTGTWHLRGLVCYVGGGAVIYLAQRTA